MDLINIIVFIHREHACCVVKLVTYGRMDFPALQLNILAFIVYFLPRICSFKILLILKKQKQTNKGEIFSVWDFSS